MLTTAVSVLLATSFGPIQSQGGKILPLQNGTLAGDKPTRAPITSGGGKSGPKDVGVIHYIDSTSKQLSLEPVRGRYRERTELFASSTVDIAIPNIRSRIRFESNKIPSFLATIQPYTKLPTRYELFPLRQQAPERMLRLFSDDWGGAEQYSEGIHVRCSHYVGDVYMLRVANLPPGEYAFKYTDSAEDLDVYCFGVDAARN